MTYYTHESDIAHEGEIDFEAITIQMEKAIAEANRIIRTIGSIDPSARSFLVNLLDSFNGTHRSFRFLYEKGKEDPRLFADAVSLMREQIEKVFMVALTIIDPAHWTDVILKDAFAKQYEEYRLKRLEYYKLPRYDEFFRYSEHQFDLMANALGISAAERGFYDRKILRLKDPTLPKDERKRTPKPATAVAPAKGGKKDDPDGFERIAQYPTPAIARDKVKAKDPIAGAVLVRWYFEYGALCAYSHVGLAKFGPGILFDEASPFTEEQKTRIRENEIDAHGLTSVVAAASALTEIVRWIGNPPHELVREVHELWKMLRDVSLFARTFWKIQAEAVFEPSATGTTSGS